MKEFLAIIKLACQAGYAVGISYNQADCYVRVAVPSLHINRGLHFLTPQGTLAAYEGLRRYAAWQIDMHSLEKEIKCAI